MKRYYCTLFDKNYLSRGLALYSSLIEHGGEFHLWILCMDELTREILLKKKLPHITLIKLEEFEDKPLLKTKKSRTHGEYCWTCTPALLFKILKSNRQIDLLSYLDSDLYFYSNPEPVFKEIDSASIGIIPHRFAVRKEYMEKNAGIYNVSMVSIKNNRDGLKCLVWWKDRCLEWCFNRVEPERYGDQKYLEQFPKLFQGVHAVENTGAGVAPWNIIQYAIKKNDKVIFVDSSPLIFFHYQALKIYEPKFGLACVPPWSYGDRNVYRSIIYEEYFQKIYEEFRKIQSLAPNFKYGFLPRQNFFAVFKENVYDLLMRLKYLFSITRGSAFQLGSYLCQSQQGRRVYRFKHDTRPDLLINHPLDQHSLVYEVGGYKGNWVAEIYSRYKCTIEVFEPVPFFADEIKKIAKGNKQIHVNKFGLSQKNTKLPIHVAGDGSSIHLKSGYPMIAKLVKVDDYIKKQKVKTIDLMQINIEGGEFDLLDHLISTGLINKVCRLQVQFHDFIPDADNRLKQIRISLAKTHKQQYAYDFVWELWEKKEKKPDVE